MCEHTGSTQIVSRFGNGIERKFRTKDLRAQVKARTLQKPKDPAPREFKPYLGEVRCRAEEFATRRATLKPALG